MVGDDEVRPARAPDAPLDEAALVVAAGGIEALAPPVAEPAYARRPFEVRKPGGEVAAGHVAVAGRVRPARGECQRHGLVRREACRPHRFLQVEQAEIILPALAQHDPAALGGPLRNQPVELAVDLVLEVAGVGRDPDGRLVRLRPEACRGEVAERLTDPGAGLGHHHMRLAGPFARLEGARGGRGVIGLARPVLGLRAQHVREPAAGFLRLDRAVGGLRLRRELGPERQPIPDSEAGPAGRPALRHAERRQHERPPEPAGFRRVARQVGRRAARVLHASELGEQRAGRAEQRLGSALQRCGAGQAGGVGEAVRRRQAELRRAHEGEQLQQVVAAEGPRVAVQPP